MMFRFDLGPVIFTEGPGDEFHAARIVGRDLHATYMISWTCSAVETPTSARDVSFWVTRIDRRTRSMMQEINPFAFRHLGAALVRRADRQKVMDAIAATLPAFIGQAEKNGHDVSRLVMTTGLRNKPDHRQPLPEKAMKKYWRLDTILQDLGYKSKVYDHGAEGVAWVYER